MTARHEFAVRILADGEVIRQETVESDDYAMYLFHGWCSDERRKDHDAEVTIQVVGPEGVEAEDTFPADLTEH